MNVAVRMFAAARQLAGSDQVQVVLPEGATVAELREGLARQVPNLADLLRGAMFAINARYAGDDEIVVAGDEVACIPPVSGG